MRLRALAVRLLGTAHPRRRLIELGQSARRLLHRRRYTAEDLVAQLSTLGLEPGSTLFVHASWNELYNLDANPAALIAALRRRLGAEGTLAMPAFPPRAFQDDPGSVFDVRRTPSAAGLLSESFRRTAGVQRSISLNHSVCAIGPRADFLLRAHHLGATSWDESSPYYRLREVDALIVGLGVGTLQATALHCIDSLLWRELPFFASLAQPPRTYRYRDASGATGEHTWTPLQGQRVAPERLRRHLPEYRERRAFGVRLFAVPARHLIDTALALARRGITMWVDPEPRPELFASR